MFGPALIEMAWLLGIGCFAVQLLGVWARSDRTSAIRTQAPPAQRRSRLVPNSNIRVSHYCKSSSASNQPVIRKAV